MRRVGRVGRMGRAAAEMNCRGSWWEKVVLYARHVVTNARLPVSVVQS